VRRRGQTLPASYYEERAGLCGDIVTEHQRRTNPGLSRSVGATSLFATAYGNVGSSIYYALGLVAAHALGLTPLVFLLAGGLFALTAQSYAEGAAMLPEAGGSSSFARHAFNEVVSFLAGWALILDYVITIAISAFFVPHYPGRVSVVVLHGDARVLGGAWMILGLTGYLAYRSWLRLGAGDVYRRGLERPEGVARFGRERGPTCAWRGPRRARSR
jgi:hypothetical protein